MIVIARSPQEIDRERRRERLRLQPTTPRCSMEERQVKLIAMAKRAQRRRAVVGAVSKPENAPWGAMKAARYANAPIVLVQM
jgi:hypothetical protein